MTRSPSPLARTSRLVTGQRPHSFPDGAAARLWVIGVHSRRQRRITSIRGISKGAGSAVSVAWLSTVPAPNVLSQIWLANQVRRCSWPRQRVESCDEPLFGGGRKAVLASCRGQVGGRGRSARSVLGRSAGGGVGSNVSLADGLALARLTAPTDSEMLHFRAAPSFCGRPTRSRLGCVLLPAGHWTGRSSCHG